MNLEAKSRLQSGSSLGPGCHPGPGGRGLGCGPERPVFKLQIHLLVGCLNILPNKEQVFKNGFQRHIKIHSANLAGRPRKQRKRAVARGPSLYSPALTTSSPGASCHRPNPRFCLSLVSVSLQAKSVPYHNPIIPGDISELIGTPYPHNKLAVFKVFSCPCLANLLSTPL